MKQERLIATQEWLDGFIKRVEAIGRTGDNRTYITAVFALRKYKPLRYALNKAIKKPVRMDGSRAHCPDCGAGIRKSDNFCFRCGQAISHEEPEKAFYSGISKRKRGKRKR